MRDPLSRKLFTTRDAREHLRGMGGIMASSPRLAETVAKFNLGGDVIAPVVGASQEPALVVYSGNNFAVFPDGRVVNTDSGVEVDDAQDPDGFLRRAVQALVSGPQPVTSVPGFGMDAFTAPIDLGGSDVYPQPTTREELLERGIVQRSFSDRLGDILDPVFSPMPDVDSEEFRALQAADPDLGAEILRRAQEAQKRRADDPAAAAADAAARTEAEAEAGDAETRAVDQATADADPLADAADNLLPDLRKDFGVDDPPPPPPKNRRERFQQELELIREVFGDRTKDESRERMANLAMIGLAIAAGQSPDALTNIAQGALAGTQAIQRAQAAAAEREDALRMKAFESVLSQEAEERKFTRDLELAGVRAGVEGSAFTKPTHPINQWFTTRNQLEQQARDPMNDLWTQTQAMSEEERRQMLDTMALETVLTGVGNTPETQELAASVRSGQLGQAFSQTPVVTTQAEYDSLPSGATFMQNGRLRRKP